MPCDICGAAEHEPCPDCGQIVHVGHWPFCPHGRGVNSVEAVTWPGGKTFENLGDQPVTFYHRSDYDKYLRTHRIEEFVRHQPVPGTDKSPHTTSWAAVSQDTLDGARAMLERVGKAGKEAPPATYIQSMTVTVTDEAGTVVAPLGTFGVFEDVARSAR